LKKKLGGIKAGEKSEMQHQINIDNSQLGPNNSIKSSTRGAKIISQFYLIL
jgi:hypothetical protein